MFGLSYKKSLCCLQLVCTVHLWLTPSTSVRSATQIISSHDSGQTNELSFILCISLDQVLTFQYDMLSVQTILSGRQSVLRK